MKLISLVLALLGCGAVSACKGDVKGKDDGASGVVRQNGGTQRPCDQLVPANGEQVVFCDDFPDFPGTPPRWGNPFNYVGEMNDGVTSTGPSGLRVVPTGTNPTTGEPAFAHTTAQEGTPDNPARLSGQWDHDKWVVANAHTSSQGLFGFDTKMGFELGCNATASGRTYGTASHPFGSLVTDPDSDPRLAVYIPIGAVDLQTGLIGNFAITNNAIYALYARAPRGLEGRPVQTPGDDYFYFAYMVPLSKTEPNQVHDLKVGFDLSSHVLRWVVDGVEQFRVDKPGSRIDEQYAVYDFGGAEQVVAPAQMDCLMDYSTFLDGFRPGAEGLVRLTIAQPYYNPDMPASTTVPFFDNASLASNRLFGQGAELDVVKSWVTYTPTATSTVVGGY